MSAPSDSAARARQGVWALLGAACVWGLLPLYLRELRALPAPLVIAYRLVLCCVFVLLLLARRAELRLVLRALWERHTRARLLASALLISVNWLLYVWAVANGRVLEASLGYFINPLLNVLLGVVFLRERLRRMQWLAVLLAVQAPLSREPLGVAWFFRTDAILMGVALAWAAHAVVTVPSDASLGDPNDRHAGHLVPGHQRGHHLVGTLR